MAEIDNARVPRGRVLMATYGGRAGRPLYGLDTGEPVSEAQVANLKHELQPTEDGLFPGFTPDLAWVKRWQRKSPSA